MTEHPTPLGLVKVGPQAELFAEAAALAVQRFDPGMRRPLFWALSGGSTPQAWYRWCVAERAIPPAVAAGTWFTVSDERWVPAASPDSNYGNAARLLLDPLGVPAVHRVPWPVELAPGAAAETYAGEVARVAGVGRAYDVCLLGLGDDAHTASLFPGSPLLDSDGGKLFATVEVPGKGRRGTITPAGLRACGLVVLLVTGAGKAGAIRRIFRGNEAPSAAPARLLQSCAARVVWLLDEAAAAGLTG
jgi:6-phosphogluconolactonase